MTKYMTLALMLAVLMVGSYYVTAEDVPTGLGIDDQIVMQFAQHATITASTATTTELVAAPGAGKRVYVKKIFIQSEGAQDCTLLSASTALTGAIEFADGDWWDEEFFRCGVNEALNLTTTQAVQINGYVIYVVR